MEKRVYLDESGFNHFLCREYGRNIRGQQVKGEVSGKRFVRESILAGLSQKKMIAPMYFQGTCDTVLFNTWLEQVLIPELEEGQVLILDNASIHKSKRSKELISAAGCKLLFLPPYSPDLNPIEKSWAKLKFRVREKLREVANFQEAMDSAIVSM